MSSVIKVENLFKKYTLRHQGGGRSRYVALRDVLTNKVTSLFRSDSTEDADQEEFLALKDVSFEVKQGENIGIIGRNGAGKSTLLKILSRITEPSGGRIEIQGRVASLLEVGTGFHPELTGRENIYLNGAILGMKRPEIKRKFDEIVSFAEVEKFLDTPVKHFSSGMYMRLAFAVAAHLESEILIVDEVLAVGDAEFQRKCLGKMDEASRHGRTVLFVSHNMQAVESLTSRCILFAKGQISHDGPSAEAVSLYLKSKIAMEGASIKNWPARAGSGGARIVSLVLQDEMGQPQDVFRPCETIYFKVGVRFDSDSTYNVQLVVENEKEQPLFTTQFADNQKPMRHTGYSEFLVRCEQNHLLPGNYLISLAVIRPDHSDCYDAALHIPALRIEGEGFLWKVPLDKRWGDLYFPCQWTLVK
ncbi:MAG: ABC transporter ATP-binding protein [Methylacidiphilales bacterium]|nr:ABC transporter ATP-binding protein [Candidatus Methylacidiphilales bacterium]